MLYNITWHMFFFYLYIFILEMLCYNMLGNMLKHWKTLQEGWVNALDTLYDLFFFVRARA